MTEKEYDYRKEGEAHYEDAKRNIPAQFFDCVKDEGYTRNTRNGRIYEKLIRKILEKKFGVEKVSLPKAIFPIERKNRRRAGGYLHPDLKINDNIYIEVTTWGDSNIIFSKIMQGYLLKKEYPKAKYYVVIADYGIDDNWTWNEDKPLWEKWSKIGDVDAVDGWFGFKGIENLIKLIDIDLK